MKVNLQNEQQPLRLRNAEPKKESVPPKIEFEPEFLRPKNFVRHRRWRQLLRLKKQVDWRSAYYLFLLVGRVLIFVFEAMFDGGRMVRKVGPGMRPLERHEFERQYRDENGRNF